MNRARVSLLALIFIFSATIQLHAYDYNNKLGVTLYGGYDTLTMGDVNQALAPYGGSIHAGPEFGLDVTDGLTKRILMTGGIGELYNSDSFNGGAISLPALSIGLGAEYVILPDVLKNFDISCGGMFEYDLLDGSTSVDPGVIDESLEGSHAVQRHSSWTGGSTPSGTAPSGQTYVVTNCVGSTLGVHFSLKERYFLFTNFAIILEEGYRFAHVYQVTGTTNGVSSQEQQSVDYTGFLSRLGASYYF